MRKITNELKLTKFISFLPFGLILLLLFTACRKGDYTKQKKGIMKEVSEGRFFGKNLPVFEKTNKILELVKRENSKYHFVENIIQAVGYPYWNKTLVAEGLAYSTRGTTGDSVSFYSIPFVRDTQAVVNALLMVKVTSTDTTIKWICDWQYSDTSYTGLDRVTSSVMMMRSDFEIFGARDYEITDTTMFSPRTKKVKLTGGGYGRGINTAGRSALMGLEIEICFYETIQAPQNGWLTGCQPGLPPGDPGCSPYGDAQILRCVSFVFGTGNQNNVNTDNGWYYVGTGTNNGGGGSASWTPPTCGGNPARGVVYEGCSTGWQPPVTILPIGINEYLKRWDDSIIIDNTVRPCILTLINQIRGLDTGVISRIIQALSGHLPGLNWEVKEISSLAAPFSNATAITQHVAAPGRNSVTTLNQSVLINATNIFVAKTLIHEAVHGFLLDYFYNAPDIPQAVKDTILPKSYGPMLKEFLKKKSPLGTNADHNIMATNFKNSIEEALVRLFPVLGITLPQWQIEELGSDLAWSGLHETDAFLNLDANEQIRILNRNTAELTNSPVSTGGIFVSPVGAKACN